jgi:Zn-finger nucleic acid-binding protein
MNFMSWTEGPKTGLELKYCERCGGLWLRPRGDSEVYCGGCRLRMAEMPPPGAERLSKPRLPRPKPEDLQGQVQIEYLQAVTELEVRP